MAQRLIPTGTCWCGCEGDAKIGKFFIPGHDKRAESAVIAVEFGGVPEFLHHYGYGPDGKNALRAVEDWRANGNRPRGA